MICNMTIFGKIHIYSQIFSESKHGTAINVDRGKSQNFAMQFFFFFLVLVVFWADFKTICKWVKNNVKIFNFSFSSYCYPGVKKRQPGAWGTKAISATEFAPQLSIILRMKWSVNYILLLKTLLLPYYTNIKRYIF